MSFLLRRVMWLIGMLLSMAFILLIPAIPYIFQASASGLFYAIGVILVLVCLFGFAGLIE